MPYLESLRFSAFPIYTEKISLGMVVGGSINTAYMISRSDIPSIIIPARALCLATLSPCHILVSHDPPFSAPPPLLPSWTHRHAPSSCRHFLALLILAPCCPCSRGVASRSNRVACVCRVVFTLVEPASQ